MSTIALIPVAPVRASRRPRGNAATQQLDLLVNDAAQIACDSGNAFRFAGNGDRQKALRTLRRTAKVMAMANARIHVAIWELSKPVEKPALRAPAPIRTLRLKTSR
jgi:hypothetical protein